MKKVLLILMMMVSFSFSAPPTYFTYNGLLYKFSSTFYSNTSGFADCTSTPTPDPRTFFDSGSGSSIILITYEGITSGSSADCGVNYFKVSKYFKSYYFLDTGTCSSPSTIVNGECIAPSDPLECDPTKGTFTNLDGQCTDCSSFLASDLTTMANCACGATDSTYVPRSVPIMQPTTFGNKSYTQSFAKCSDGSEKEVYFNETPIDNNNTTPSDNNSTSPTDNNTSIPTDNNGTQDGNGTVPSDGNGTKPPSDGNGTGTGSGKDYSGQLQEIINNLKGVNSGINGSFPIDSISHNIPSDTSGASWENYAETWNNISGSFNEVTNKVSDFKGLVQGGFSNPFSKGSTTTCRYTTSFEFGAVGSIPVDFDLCQVFSPLRSVFYTFAYLFFSFFILVFHVKMFLRLV